MTSLPPTADDELLARAYSGRGWFRFWLGDCAGALEDGRRSLGHAARVHSVTLEDEVTGLVSAAMVTGPTPWPAVEQFVDDRLAAGLGRFGGRGGSDMRNHAPLIHAARGDFDTARAEFAEMRKVRAESGATMFEHTIASSVASVELLAGDLVEAERILRESWVGLGEAGERGFRSTTGGMLAAVLVRLGELDEAESVTEESEQLASPDDVHTWILTRVARALLASARGRHDEALREAGEAQRLAGSTDYLEKQVEVAVVLAEVLIAAGRPEDARDPVLNAIVLAERKGSIVLADRARDVLERASV
jgi:hypothetical protein